MKNHYPKTPVINAVKYYSVVETLPELSRQSEESIVTKNLKSPMDAKLSVHVSGSEVVLDVILINRNNYSWYYPGDFYHLDGSFVLMSEDKKTLISGFPVWIPSGVMVPTDQMFLEVDALSEFQQSGRFDANNLLGEGKNSRKMCAIFGNSQMPPSLQRIIFDNDPDGFSRQILLESNYICFDLIRDGDGFRMENISDV